MLEENGTLPIKVEGDSKGRGWLENIKDLCLTFYFFIDSD